MPTNVLQSLKPVYEKPEFLEIELLEETAQGESGWNEPPGP